MYNTQGSTLNIQSTPSEEDLLSEASAAQKEERKPFTQEEISRLRRGTRVRVIRLGQKGTVTEMIGTIAIISKNNVWVVIKEVVAKTNPHDEYPLNARSRPFMYHEIYPV
jgi:hypothetical protein